MIFNGRADWVYFEEFFNRSRKAYLVESRSKRHRLPAFDDVPVKKFTVLDQFRCVSASRRRYPKAGDPNPLVQVGIVAADGGHGALGRPRRLPRRQPLSSPAPAGRRTTACISTPRIAPRPGSISARSAATAASPSVLFRDTTKAWVDDPGAATLSQGRLVAAAQRTQRLEAPVSFRQRRQAEKQVTSGAWEVRTFTVSMKPAAGSTSPACAIRRCLQPLPRSPRRQRSER